MIESAAEGHDSLIFGAPEFSIIQSSVLLLSLIFKVSLTGKRKTIRLYTEIHEITSE